MYADTSPTTPTHAPSSGDRFLVLCVVSGLIHVVAGAALLHTWDSPPAAVAEPTIASVPVVAKPRDPVVRLELAVVAASAHDIIDRAVRLASATSDVTPKTTSTDQVD